MTLDTRDVDLLNTASGNKSLILPILYDDDKQFLLDLNYSVMVQLIVLLIQKSLKVTKIIIEYWWSSMSLQAKVDIGMQYFEI